MKAYIAKRLLFLIPMFFLVSFAAFTLMNLTTENPAMIILRSQGIPNITQDMIDQVTIEYGFD